MEATPHFLCACEIALFENWSHRARGQIITMYMAQAQIALLELLINLSDIHWVSYFQMNFYLKIKYWDSFVIYK